MELNSINITRKNLFSSTKKIKNVIFLHFFKPKRFFVPRKQQNWEVKNIEVVCKSIGQYLTKSWKKFNFSHKNGWKKFKNRD
jgi:hypothetical protein